MSQKRRNRRRSRLRAARHQLERLEDRRLLAVSIIDTPPNEIWDQAVAPAELAVAQSGPSVSSLGPLIGIDIEGGASSPTNWTTLSSLFSAGPSNLIGEDGIATTVDLTTNFTGSSTGTRGLSPTASSVPQHTQSLLGIGTVGDGNTGTSYTATFSDLDAFAEYRVYVFGIADDFVDEHSNDVTITGLNSVSFTQAVDNNDLYINGSVGSSAQDLSNYAELIIADAAGEIEIEIEASAGVDGYGLAGLAIQATGNAGDILTVTIDSDSISENGGTSTATVTRSTGMTGNLTVNLSSDDTSEATVPNSVTIADGFDSATFTISAVDDAISDGTQAVQITASATGFSDGSDTIDILDDEAGSTSLVGVDFGSSGPSPINWTLNTVFNTTLTDLINEEGNSTPFDLSVSGFSGAASGTPLSTQLPAHSQSLVDIAGNFFASNTTATMTWSDLDPSRNYEVYVFGLDSFNNNQSVTITGSGTPVTFDQNYPSNTLLVNGVFGSDTQTLGSYAEIITPSATGQISIDVTSGSFLGVGGLAIRELAPPPPPGSSVLVGVDFANSGPSPTNWTLNTDFNTTLTNLIDEQGNSTAFDLSVAGFGGVSTGSPPASQLPIHTQSLSGVDGNFFGSNNTATMTWSDLDPTRDYEVYVFGLDNFTNNQNVTITGAGAPVTFAQNYPPNTLLVNGAIGSSAQTLESFAETITPTASGQIVIDVTSNSFYGVGGLAIRELSPPAPDLAVTLDENTLSEADGPAATTVTITRGTDTSNALDLILTSSDSTEATVPAMVTIPAGQSSVTVDLDAIDDTAADGDQLVTIKATVAGGTTNGSTGIDTTFGTSGQAATQLNTASIGAKNLLVQPDGKILAASSGFNSSQFLLERLNADGTPDASFGTGGLTFITIANGVSPKSIALQDDGKILVAGDTFSGSSAPFLARLNDDGSLDTSFGVGGLVDFSSSPVNTIEQIDVAADGKVLVAAQVFGRPEMYALRLRADGLFDNTFGSNGLKRFDEFDATPSAIKVLANNQLLLVGNAGDRSTIIRANADGTLDTSFGSSGSTRVVFDGDHGAVHSIAVDVDGRIALAGSTFLQGTTANDFAVAMLTPDGLVDTTFDSDGIVNVDLAPAVDQLVTSVQFQADGKLLAVGYNLDFTLGNEIAVTRLNSDGSLDTSFDGDGILTFSAGNSNGQGPVGSVVTDDGDLLVLAGGGGDLRVTKINTGVKPLYATEDVLITDNDGAATLDFGDAASSSQSGFAATYPVTLSDNGARHTNTGPVLGLSREAELDGVNSVDASFDDDNGSDDEDGVTFLSPIIASPTGASTASVEVQLSNANATANRLDAWIDFNRDGDWSDPGEQIFANFDLGTTDGVQTLTFSVPQDTGANVENGYSFARFRVSTGGGLGVIGFAPNGEVEDHRVAIVTADPFIVDTLTDEIDGDYSANDLSLREAIDLANTRPGTDQIVFAPALSGGAITLQIEQLSVTDDLIISGPGASNMTIDANGSFRVFELHDLSGSLFVELEGLTLTGGHSSRTVHPGSGGAINSTGDLTLRDVNLINNHVSGGSANGGGVFLFGSGSEALVIEDSVIANNSATGFNAFSGGIYAENANVEIRRSLIDQNATDPSSGQGIGGGLFVIEGSLQIEDSTISRNSAVGGLGGGVVSSGGETTISGTTISGNSAGVRGGGVLFGSTTNSMTISNSTISGNTTSIGNGGGISIFQGTTHIRHSTITGNVAPDGFGSGVAGNNNGTYVSDLQVLSSIISGNANSDVDNLLAGSGTNTFTSNGFNLIGTGNAASVFNLTTDQNGVTAPGLLPLANNGGLTDTHALEATSPALDAGDTAAIPTSDQRGSGFARLNGVRVDIGAFEANLISISPLDASKDEGDSATIAFTFTVSRTGPTTDPVTADFAVTGSGSDPADADDFDDGILPSGQVTIPAGQTSTVLTIDVVGDATVEPDEGFTVTLSNPTSPLLLDISTADGLIENDDTPSTPEVESIIYFNKNANAEADLSPDSTGQRSIIRQIEVTFTGPVSVPVGPITDDSFIVESTTVSPGTQVGLSVLSSQVVNGKQIVILGFTGTTLIEDKSENQPGILPTIEDGRYRLTIDGAKLGIDANGTESGVDKVDNFFRLFGDADGGETVNLFDFAKFRDYFTNQTLLEVFDMDDDTNATLFDFADFRSRFNKPL